MYEPTTSLSDMLLKAHALSAGNGMSSAYMALKLGLWNSTGHHVS